MYRVPYGSSSEEIRTSGSGPPIEALRVPRDRSFEERADPARLAWRLAQIGMAVSGRAVGVVLHRAARNRADMKSTNARTFRGTKRPGE